MLNCPKPELGAVELRRINTAATTKAAHLAHPELGARLDVEALDALKPVGDDAQILISDGLSAEAIHHNIPRLLPLLLKELADAGISVGAPLLAPNGRVKLAEAVGDALAAKLVISLIGERPGGDGMASRSMSAYLAYHVGDATGAERRNAARYEYTVISNIYDQGAPPEAAAAMIAEKVRQILSHQAAGNRLEALLQRRQ